MIIFAQTLINNSYYICINLGEAMRKKSMHVVLISSLLIFSSLAGCLGDTEEEEATKATVIVSTYHVEQIVSAIAGDTLNVEILAPSNVPVHDYEPSATDLVRLQNADMFFYHGLGLETWIDATMDSLGNDAPPSYATHAMPTGQTALDYEGILVDQLCSSLSAPGTTDVHILSESMYFADEIHSDNAAHNLAMPEDDHHDDHGDDDHDGHGDDDHDGHGDDDHDGHGDHDDHDHGDHDMIEAEDTLTASSDCPTGTTISVYELEAGEYMLEFEAEDMETFTIAIAAMGGAHHHHHHGHGDGPFEWAGIFSVSDSTHTWTMEKVDGTYADPSMRVVIIPTDTPTEATLHSLEGGVEALIEGDCKVVEDGETMTPIAADGSCFELHVGSGDISSFNMDTAGITGFAAYTAHSPYEFENTQHYLKDSAGEDVEHVAEEGGGGHGDHGGHGDSHGDDHSDHWESDVCHDMDTHENHDEYTTEEDCVAAGHMWMEGEHEDMDADEMIEMFDTDSDGLLSLNEFLTMAEEMGGDDHDHDDDDDSGDDSGDDHDEHNPAHEIEMAVFEIMFHMADMNEDENLNGDELDRLMDAMEGDLPIDGEEMAEIYFEVFDEDENNQLTLSEFSEMMEAMMSDEDDHDHDDSGTHDEDDDDDMTEMMFAMYDADEDGNISMEEFSEVMSMMGDDHEEGVAFIGFHVEEEGDYGFALPAGVELHVLSTGGHDGHDDHGAHDDHDDHGDEDAHDDHGDDHGDEDGHDDHSDEEEALAYDPHSWLDPLAYKAQVALVLGEMKTVFPDLADTFQANADAFMASLDEVDADYSAAFGPNGTCTNNTVAANHNAYSYIAYRYDLEFVTVHGLDPEGEPSAADIAEVVEKIEEDAITVLYIEEYTDETAVNSIVEQTNGAVTVQTLYTMELPPKDSSDDYLSLMGKNLNSLKAGLGC